MGNFFLFFCSLSAWKANFSFSTCRVFCIIVIASLGCWGGVFHLSLLACLASLSPGWGTSLKNQHLSGWVTNCFILVNGQDEMGQWERGRCLRWAVLLCGRGGSVMVLICLGTLHWAAGSPWLTGFIKSLLSLWWDFPLGPGGSAFLKVFARKSCEQLSLERKCNLC